MVIIMEKILKAFISVIMPRPIYPHNNLALTTTEEVLLYGTYAEGVSRLFSSGNVNV